jgi:Flp pilus assembly protein TadG
MRGALPTGRRGSSMIESALALALLLLLTLAIVDVGRYLYAANLLPYLAREGARYASIHGADDERVRAHVRKLVAGLPAGSVEVEVSVEESSPAVMVRTRWTFTPAAGIVLGQSVPVTGRSRLPLRRRGRSGEEHSRR